MGTLGDEGSGEGDRMDLITGSDLSGTRIGVKGKMMLSSLSSLAAKTLWLSAPKMSDIVSMLSPQVTR